MTEPPPIPTTDEQDPSPDAQDREDHEVPLLTEPRDGVPEVVTTVEALGRTTIALAGGTGPLAVDAERAHGFRYSQRAYLIQLRRVGSGTHLIDPVAFGEPADLSALGAALGDAEWIIHAASQDLPCLHEIGLVPRTLFDTELAARLLGYPRVALGTMIEELFGVRLLKEHSASDWSSRPLPQEWLNYATLDVELLIELRDRLAEQLVAAGKWEWARQEFAALVAGAGVSPVPRVDPWRRTSGIHKVRTRRGLGYVAALWYARDAVARRLDRAPGKILPDAAISDLASLPAPDRGAMRQVPAFARRQARRFELTWVDAMAEVDGLGETELPAMHVTNEGPPQPRLWASKDPEAAARLTRAREALGAQATALDLPVENLLTPDFVRRLAWRPPTPTTGESVEAVLAGLGARRWQRELTGDLLTAALTAGTEPGPADAAYATSAVDSPPPR